MSLHRLEFMGLAPEWSEYEMDLDPDLNDDEKIDLAMGELRELFPEYQNIIVEKVEEI